MYGKRIDNQQPVSPKKEGGGLGKKSRGEAVTRGEVLRGMKRRFQPR